MDSSWLFRVLAGTLAASLTLFSQSESFSQAPKAPGAHRIAVLEGEVVAGQAFERPMGNGLKIFLEPIESGWVLRVVPVTGLRGPHDYAELANPPYQSVSPLLIGTDFNFRAQDALAWNPRRFHFAASAQSFEQLLSAYHQLQRLTGAFPAEAQSLRIAESQLATLVSQTPQGELTILDARLVQGTANQAAAAGLIALHPNRGARQIEQPAHGDATPLGQLNWVRFRIRLDLPASFHCDRTLRIDRSGSF